jgi:hypothetical protein
MTIRFLGSSPQPSITSSMVRIEGVIKNIGRITDRPPYNRQIMILTRSMGRAFIYYHVPEGFQLPLQNDDHIVMDYAFRFEKKTRRIERAFVIRDKKGEIRLIRQNHDLLPQNLIPASLRVTRGRQVIYVETGFPLDLCYTVTEHRNVIVGPSPPSRTLQPGESAIVSDPTGTYRFILLDNAQSKMSSCDNHAVDRLDWLALRIGPPEMDLDQRSDD